MKQKLNLKGCKYKMAHKTVGYLPLQAIATALLNGLDMSQITFHQEDMRQHLISCFTARLLTPFPTTN